MPLDETLARVDADLAAGRVPLARQRLRGLVGSYPWDLTLRRRLAAVYRLYGDAAEAGRWMYLEEDRDPQETAAFERRYVSARWRMKALAWRGPEALAATPFAADRLAEVREACAAEVGRPVAWDEPVPFDGHGPVEEGGRSGCVVVTVGAFLGGTVMAGIWLKGLLSLFE
ncbi:MULTISPECIES: DUF6584 family protein [unclassified Streptomyces]|jgi:hypothetical protein|uniref:DUF6584 family protein n=1 Tax=unclassified Streptomyces TaxID=2593676 RepID=UPI00368B1DC0